MREGFNEGFDPEQIKTKEESNSENIVDYYEQDIEKQRKELAWLEVRKGALEDLAERKHTVEALTELLKSEIDEFDINIKIKKSMINLTEQKLAEKKLESENKQKRIEIKS